MSTPDLSTVRARFPALAREHAGRPAVFLDAPGGSQVPEIVIEAMAAYLRASNANTHGAFPTSQETDRTIEDAHAAAADLLHADPDEVVFGPNATTLLLAISRSVGRTLGPGDEVVVTRLDHDANVRPWVLAAQDAGATVRWVDVRDDDVTLDPRSFEDALSVRTKVVAITLASNAVGTITPAADLARAVHERTSAIVVFDGVHLAQHRSIDVRALGADLLAVSPYKIFGPHLGILFGRRELLRSLTPYKVRPASDDLPYRFETGTQNHEGFAGWTAAVDYLAEVGRMFGNPAGPHRRDGVAAAFGVFAAWEHGLAARFLEGARSVPGLRVYGITDPERLAQRTPTFAVRLGDRHPRETAKALGERGIFVWDGHYYALELMERLGLQETGGAVRIGFCHYNTPAEVDRVLEELSALA
ncbi:MAG TPA: cysteine desulfurase-like protein [Actinomycetota bacterium]|nr:cysteine desulfurase-like protein [Actinomycetota bacterium]